MKTDSQKLHYFDETDKGKEIIFSNLTNKKDNSKFYELLNIKNYIIKYPKKELTEEDIFNMLNHFSQTNTHLSDLPIAYYKEKDTLKGTVIPYYQDSISLYEVINNKDLLKLSQHYHHDDDKLHNLYLLLNDILNILEELQDNNISYIDSNPSNFLFKDNQIKIIDFDPKYLRYDSTKKNIQTVLSRYDDLLYNVHISLNLDNLTIYNAKNYKSMRKHLIKVENKIRKKIYK